MNLSTLSAELKVARTAAKFGNVAPFTTLNHAAIGPCAGGWTFQNSASALREMTCMADYSRLLYHRNRRFYLARKLERITPISRESLLKASLAFGVFLCSSSRLPARQPLEIRFHRRVVERDAPLKAHQDARGQVDHARIAGAHVGGESDERERVRVAEARARA